VTPNAGTSLYLNENSMVISNESRNQSFTSEVLVQVIPTMARLGYLAFVGAGHQTLPNAFDRAPMGQSSSSRSDNVTDKSSHIKRENELCMRNPCESKACSILRNQW